MPIDDKLAQAQALVESDERQRGVGGEVILELLRLSNSVPILKDLVAPIVNPLQAILETLHRWRLDNVRYLVDVTIERVQELSIEVQSLSDAHKAFIQEEWVKLVVDGSTKAQQARAKERVKRLGEILGYAYVKGPAKPPDLTEEMLRIAMALDENDTRVLRWLCEGMKDKYEAAAGQVDYESANDFWGKVDRHGRTRSGGAPELPLGLSVGDLMTCCAKLQAFGLVVQVMQNRTKVSPATLPYSPLKRGYEFIEYVRRS